jgi:phosphatidylinositol 4-kinase
MDRAGQPGSDASPNKRNSPYRSFLKAHKALFASYDDPKLADAEFWQASVARLAGERHALRGCGDRAAVELCDGAIGYVKWMLRPLLQLDTLGASTLARSMTANGSGTDSDDSLLLLEHVLHFACLIADETNLRTLVKEMYLLAGELVGLAGKVFDDDEVVRTLIKLALLCLVHLKGAVYADLCAIEPCQCQSLVQNLLSLALGSSRLALGVEGRDMLGLFTDVADDRLEDIRVCLVWEVMEHIGGLVAASWRHGKTSQAQQDLNFLDIVSEDKFVPFAVSLVVLRKLQGSEDVSRMLIPALIDAVLVQAARLDVWSHEFAVHVLASMGVVCAAYSNFWGFSTILSILVKLFKFPDHRISAEMMFGSDSGRRNGSRAAGTLSRGLLLLTEGCRRAPLSFRKFLRKHLLMLFSDFALLMPNESYVEDLGSMLPALAGAITSIQASFVVGRISSVLSSGDLSLDALKEIQEEGRIETAAFRHLWFCAAVYDFGSIRSTESWPVEWSLALYVIAPRTPILLIGSEQQQESVFLDHIAAEFGGWLSSFGNRANPKSLLETLRRTVECAEAKRSAKPELCCHILTVAYIARVHALVSDVGRDVNSAVERSPIDHCVIHAQFSLPTSCEYSWYKDIIMCVFSKYLDRLRELKVSAGYEDEAFAVQSAAFSTSLMIESLVQQGPNDDIPHLMVKMLQMILPCFPSLYFSSEIINGALQAVATERQMNTVSAGSVPLEIDPRLNASTAASRSAPTTASVYLLDLIRSAASRAPSVIEAIVGENLRHMGPASGDDSGDDGGSSITGSIAPSVMEALQQGRADCSLPDSMGAFRGVIAWSAKIRALGVFHGLVMQGSEGTDVLRQRAEQLALKVREGGSKSAICNSIMDLAAACVSHHHESRAAAALQLLAWIPLMVVDDSVMKTVCLAWHWIICACPEMAAPLLDNITNAWCSKQNVGMGIFDRNAGENFDEFKKCVDVQRTWVVFWTEMWRSSGDRDLRNGSMHDWGWISNYGSFADTATSSESGVRGWNLECNMLRVAESIVGDTNTSNLNRSPYSCSTRFRLLDLVMEILLTSHAIRELKPGMDSLIASRYSDIVAAALAWFADPVAWVETSPGIAKESYIAVKDFGDLLFSMEEHLKGLGIKIVSRERTDMLSFLVAVEMGRLALWMQPIGVGQKRKTKYQVQNAPRNGWKSLAEDAWKESPRLALAVGTRFPNVAALHTALRQLVVRNAADPSVQSLSEAVQYLVTAPPSADKSAAFELLSSWTPMGLEQTMSLMSKPVSRDRTVFDYIIRCLQLCDPNDVSFFLPQLVQLLRHDPDKGVETFLLDAASRSPYFAFLLKCQLLSEGTPPDEAFAPEVKRAGWQPPSDTGLWTVADATYKTLLDSLKGQVREHLDAESRFFDDVTEVSGKLYPIPKDDRKAAAVEFLSAIAVSRNDLFMPFCHDTIIKSVKPETAAPMQSAAKCPILVAFDVEDRRRCVGGGSENARQDGEEGESSHREPRGISKVEAAIFKVGDDCRQDVLALQVVELVKRKFDEVGLPLPLVPYGVIPTGYECGIIQVVPNAKSRAQLGEVTDGGLLDVFQHEFGLPGSARFEAARRSLIESSAAYAIVSYILQAKDRHNGNIMVDNTGKLIHIDFGFIFGISPGGNMGFESAAFKLSYEMTELLDPGNTRNSVHFLRFQELCIKGYLVARTVADSIVATVEMMMPSKLPCFSRGAPIDSLRERFHLEMSDQQAAAFMKSLINDAYDKWTTGTELIRLSSVSPLPLTQCDPSLARCVRLDPVLPEPNSKVKETMLKCTVALLAFTGVGRRGGRRRSVMPGQQRRLEALLVRCHLLCVPFFIGGRHLIVGFLFNVAERLPHFSEPLRNVANTFQLGVGSLDIGSLGI